MVPALPELPAGCHVINLQVRVAVPRAAFSLAPGLDCMCRAEMNTAAADFAPVFPDRFAADEFDIAGRADRCTGTAGSAGIADSELPVLGAGM